jgi:hypothetical protein
MIDETFSRNLYLEHLEEAALLYVYLLSSFNDNSDSSEDKKEIEERFETHIDALVIGGEFAINICMEQLQTGDEEVLYPCLCLFRRQNRLDLVREIQNLFSVDITCLK